MQWPVDGGEMGERIRAFDWSTTALGPIDRWPQVLRTAVDLMLGSAQPVYIAWGPQHVSLHNDGYIPILGSKHPSALGRPYAQVWHEIWDEYRPVVEATMQGRAQHWVDQPVRLAGRQDRPISWFTFSWTPLRDETGDVGGIYCVATETTDRIVAEQALLASLDEGFCVLEMLLDEGGTPDFRYLQTNPAFEVQGGIGEACGKTVRQLLPGIEDECIRRFHEVAATGRPARFVQEVRAMGKWFDVYAFRYGDGGSRRVGVLFRDITERRRTEEAYRASQLRAENALAIAELGTFDWNLRTNDVQVSGRTRAIFGFAPGRGTTAAEYFGRIHSDDLERVRAAIEAALAADGKLHIAYRIRRPDGEVRHVDSMSAGTRAEDGGWEREIGVFIDVTDRIEREERLHDANRRKDEFLAMLAHELRNPLAPIAAAAELLQMAPANPDLVGRSGTVIARQVLHLTGLVDDLLDVSRVTRGRVTLERTALDARHVVSMAVEQVRPMLQFRRHALDVQLPEQPALVLGDGKRLVQVLTNLLTNSAKYTHAGGRITLALQPEGEQVCLSVADDGVGMAPELVAQCFDLFVQAERTSDRTQGGLGIGLALVKSLVELHGGSVRAQSDGPGKGSRFTVSLPRYAAATPNAAPERPRAPATADVRRKVLVVDDNTDAAETLALLVQALGHEALVEHDPRAALERIEAEHPEIALVDVGLPGMDGYELARSVRERAGGTPMTLVAVTGYGQPQDREKALRAGFDEHLVKPADIGRLQQLLATARNTAAR